MTTGSELRHDGSVAPSASTCQLPTASLLIGVAVPSLLLAGIWAGAIAISDAWNHAEFVSGLTGVGLMLVMALAGVLIMTPWKSRRVEEWMIIWLAATVFRLLGAPTAAFLLYSAASSTLAAKPFGLAVALTYMATLFVEAVILARHMKAVSDLPHAISHSHRSP